MEVPKQEPINQGMHECSLCWFGTSRVDDCTKSGQDESNSRSRTKKAIAKITVKVSDRQKYRRGNPASELANDHHRIYVENQKVKNVTRPAKSTVDKSGKIIWSKTVLDRVILASKKCLSR